jgi:undecaprenyl-diphosphatase
MIEKLKTWDEELFLWLNAQRVDWLDPIMFQISATITWLPLFIFLIYLIFKSDRANAWWILGGVALTILAADQFASGFLKPLVERLRPCHDPRWEGVMFNYQRCGGLYGFVSSHAANTFGVTVFLNLKLKGKVKHLRWLYVYAVVVSYSRIYLGVHYPGDVIAGALIGTFFAWVCWFLIVFVKRELIKRALK